MAAIGVKSPYDPTQPTDLPMPVGPSEWHPMDPVPPQSPYGGTMTKPRLGPYPAQVPPVSPYPRPIDAQAFPGALQGQVAPASGGRYGGVISSPAPVQPKPPLPGGNPGGIGTVPVFGGGPSAPLPTPAGGPSGIALRPATPTMSPSDPFMRPQGNSPDLFNQMRKNTGRP